MCAVCFSCLSQDFVLLFISVAYEVFPVERAKPLIGDRVSHARKCIKHCFSHDSVVAILFIGVVCVHQGKWVGASATQRNTTAESE